MYKIHNLLIFSCILNSVRFYHPQLLSQNIS
nr:MAG TPA: hypothetical protein [Caudoviricetes sp.]